MKSLTELQAMSDKDIAGVIADVDASSIPGRALRRRFNRISRKQGGFTLLELLVVVAILAVLGGLAIAALGDKTSQAARGAATQGIADVESKLRSYQALTGVLPSSLDTLLCADSTTAGALTGFVELGGTSDLPGTGGGMGANIANKLNEVDLPAGMVDALVDAGITNLRYGYLDGTNSSCDNTDGAAIAAPAAVADIDYGAGFGVASPTAYPNAPLQEADIPNRVFDTPVASGSTSNRGRGFVAQIGTGTGLTADIPVVLWQRGRNQRVGAAFNDFVVAFGIGNNATHVTDTGPNRVNSQAGYYGDIGRDKYGRYVGLFKVGEYDDGTTPATGAVWTQADVDNVAAEAASKATLVAVVDARGDFLDEEFAEARGQKL